MSKTVTCRSCCPSCGLHFAGDTAFDLHLGSHHTGWEHRDPSEVRNTKTGRRLLRVKTTTGECRLRHAPQHGVTIWQEDKEAPKLPKMTPGTSSA